MKKTLIYLTLLLFTINCNSQINHHIEITREESSAIEKMLIKKEIEFIKKKEFWNGEVNLYGEKIDSTITKIYKPYYTIDWDKENAIPNVFFNNIPLKEPIFLTNVKDELKIFTATLGNTKPIDIKELNVFDDIQVITLKENLIKEYGEYTSYEEDTYQGNIYYWDLKNKVIKLSIENECLCEDANSYRPKDYNEIPKGGRFGLLTIYYGITPQFY